MRFSHLEDNNSAPFSISANEHLATNIHTSPQNTYSISQTSQSENPPIPRFRSSSAVFQSGLDLRNQYRPHQSPNQSLPQSSIAQTGVTGMPRASSYASAYSTGGFQSAPLLPAAEFQMPRTPDLRAGESAYQMAHLSGPMTAPMAAPQDFSAAYQSEMSPGRSGNNDQETQPSDSQQHETVGITVPHSPQEQHSTQQPKHQTDRYHDGYGIEASTIRSRKRTFSMSENYEESPN